MEAGYVKGCLAERFALGDVDHGIEVYDIGRRAVRLIAYTRTVRVSPVSPHAGEILLEYAREGHTVVVQQFGSAGALAVVTEQVGYAQLESVAVFFIELLKQSVAPV